MTERFTKIINIKRLLTIFAKNYIIDVWQGFRYVSVLQTTFL